MTISNLNYNQQNDITHNVIKQNDFKHNVIKQNDSHQNITAHLKNVNICLNSNFYSYLESSLGQSSNLYLNVVHFFNTSVNKISGSLRQLFSCIDV